MTRVVVVGGGVAGLTFAHVLRRESRGNVDIVVLESGERRVGTAQLPMDDPHFTHADSLVVRTAERGPEWYPRGRGVGGGALINGRLAMAGAPSFWDAWSTDHGAVGWSWERIEPHVAAVPVVEVLSPEMNRWANAGRAIGWTVLPTQVFGQPIDDMIGGAVVEQAHVDALVMDAGHVVGVRSAAGYIVRADHVVLAAGALASPGLVLSSGLLDSTSVHGLKDHPAVSFTVRATGGTHAGIGVVCERDDMQIIAMHARDHVTIVGAALKVYAQGSIAQREKDTVAMMNMLSDARDVENVSQCLDEMIRFVSCLGMDEQVFCGTDATPLGALRAMKEIERVSWIRRNVSGNWHASCSMPMGGGGLVDADGRVAGSDNVWCCDASVMCDLPRTPTQLPTMAVASEIAARFAATCVTS